jgi:pre-rRNA-processing protein TSR3
LRGREGFTFWNYPRRDSDALTNYVRLGMDGPLLGEADRERGLLVLDGTWRWAAVMERDYEDVPVRSLPAWETAYPRTSKMFDDPSAGLATIEAVYAACHILDRDTTGLLDEYHWADEFLRLNSEEEKGTADQRG